MVLSGPKVKRLNKEMVTQVLLDNFDFSPELICEIVECIWRSSDAVEQGTRAANALTVLDRAFVANAKVGRLERKL